jgi:transmembrane sensor
MMSPQVIRQANEWIVRLRDEVAQPADFAAFEAWLAADPNHRTAYDHAQNSITRIRTLGADLGHHVERRAVQRRRVHAAAGLAAAILLAGGLVAAPSVFGPPAYDSPVGEQRVIALSDGSRVELNTNTKLVVRFSEGERRIDLLRGEALFDVAHDTTRPFIVHADGRSVRAVGTKFTVRTDPGGALSVLVVEGIVAVSPPAAASAALPAAPPPLLKAGQQLDLTEGEPALTVVPKAEIERNLSWRTGWLEFNGQPLSLAASEVARYTGMRFVIDDPGLGAMPVWAYFRADDVDGFLASLEQNGRSLVVEREGDDVRLERRAKATN